MQSYQSVTIACSKPVFKFQTQHFESLLPVQALRLQT
jgi:hypothetical protein